MPKFQVCPYCSTVYRYKDIILLKGKEHECYHCHKKFGIKKGYRAIPVAIACVIMVAVNLLLFHSTDDISKNTFLMIVLTDAAVILAAFVISPKFIRLTALSKKDRMPDNGRKEEKGSPRRRR